MKSRWFNIDLKVEIWKIYFSLSTPDFTHENHRPSWLPHWKLYKPEFPCECDTFFLFNWFFHFTLAWPSKKLGTWGEDGPEMAKMIGYKDEQLET